MRLNQNDFEHIKDLFSRKQITLNEAHIRMVEASRVLLVTSRLPAYVRRALNAAVKTNRLGHMKKDAGMREVYFHPTFDYLARAERKKHAESVIRALANACG